MKNQKSTNIKSYLVDLNDYQIIHEINRGGFASISLIERKKDRRQLAAKVDFGNNSTNKEKNISREIAILMRIQSPTIIRFYGFSLHDFQGNLNPTILMEYHINGSLRQLIEKEQKGQCPHAYDNTAKQIILCGIAHGMMTLHSRRIIHRDLKPDNVLLDENLYPIITDFGLSKFLDPTNSRQSMSGGTASYISPECINDTRYNSKADVYSFGILMFEVLTGEFAFTKISKESNPNPFHITKLVSNGKRPEFTVPVKPSFKTLIERCWSQDPKERPTFRELFHKLSLSTEEDDETIESSIRDIISKEEDDDDEDNDDYQYLLDDVDTDRFFDYVDEITNESIRREEGLQQLLEEQTKRIKELEERHQQEIEQLKEESRTKIEKLQSENKRIARTSMLNQAEIELLKLQLSQIISHSDPKIASIEIESTVNPLDGLSFQHMNETIRTYQWTKITIPSSVTSIEDNAFSYCDSLTEITIPSSVTSIGNNAFSYCSSLTQITIPSSVTSIGDAAFYNCSSLTEVTIPSSVTSIEDNAFSNCDSLTEITIPSSVTSIGNNAFSYCSSLTQITIPSSVTSIGDAAFYNCNSLTKVPIPSSVTSIGNKCFSNCSSLTEVTIPSSVTSIGNKVFSYCSSLTQIMIPSSITFIGEGSFNNCSSLAKVAIPSSVTSIGKAVFEGCTSLTEIIIPSSVKSIGNNAFTNCSSLEEIIIPSSMTSIGEATFYNCESLRKVTIPSSVISIEDAVFYNCTSLKDIIIPSSVTSIGNYAFSDCSAIAEITIPSSLTSIGDGAFHSCDKLDLAIKQKLRSQFGSRVL